MQTLAWTPDGTALLVAGEGSENERGWWTVDPMTGAAKLLAPQGDEPRPTLAGMPVAGTKIYLRHTMEGTMRVLQYDVRSGDRREIFRALAGQRDQSGPDPVVSRDGTKLFYRRPIEDGSKPPFRQIAFMERDLQTGAERSIATGQFGGVWPSPDGRYLATASNDPSTKGRALVLVDIQTGQSRKQWSVRLPDDLASGKVASNGLNNPLSVNVWAPDSQSVLVNARPSADKPGELWWVPAGPGVPTKILSPWEPSTVRVHPDGSRIAVQVGTRQPSTAREVWRLENVLNGPTGSGR
jgi:WD40 repeat protein